MSAALLITWHFREHPWNGLSNSGIWRSKQTQRCVITDLLINSSAWLEDGDGETSGKELLLSIDSQSVHRGSSEWLCVRMWEREMHPYEHFCPRLKDVHSLNKIQYLGRLIDIIYSFKPVSSLFQSLSQWAWAQLSQTGSIVAHSSDQCMFISLWQEASTFTLLSTFKVAKCLL